MTTRPTIRARFDPDPTQPTPVGVDTKGRRHYGIRLSMEGLRDDTYMVVYDLHPSYLNPRREVTQGPDFTECITSYGDFTIVATAYSQREGRSLAQTHLSRALEESATGPGGEVSAAPTPEFLRALDDIRSN